MEIIRNIVIVTSYCEDENNNQMTRRSTLPAVVTSLLVAGSLSAWKHFLWQQAGPAPPCHAHWAWQPGGAGGAGRCSRPDIWLENINPLIVEVQVVAALLPGYPTIVSNFTGQRPRTAGDKLKDKAPPASPTCWQSQSQLYKSVEPVGTRENQPGRSWAELTQLGEEGAGQRSPEL